jgi:hypothetical protein
LALPRPEFGFTEYGGGQLYLLIDRRTALGLAGMFACAFLNRGDRFRTPALHHGVSSVSTASQSSVI